MNIQCLGWRHIPPPPSHTHTGVLIRPLRSCLLYSSKLATQLPRVPPETWGIRWDAGRRGSGLPKLPPTHQPPTGGSGLAARGEGSASLLSSLPHIFRQSSRPRGREGGGFSADALICCARAICRVCATRSPRPHLDVNDTAAAAAAASSPVRRDCSTTWAGRGVR